jgi:hypothetical protein
MRILIIICSERKKEGSKQKIKANIRAFGLRHEKANANRGVSQLQYSSAVLFCVGPFQQTKACR